MTKRQIIFYVILGAAASIAFPVNFDMTQAKVKNKEYKPIEDKPLYHMKYNDTMYCAICEFLINQGEEFITKRTTESDAIHFLDHICMRLPKANHDDCEIFIYQHYEKIIDLIAEKESPHTVCTQLHFCKDYDHKVSNCDFCKYASHRIERFLSRNNTLNDIIDFGNMFCESYHSRYENVCKNTIPFYYSSIVAKLIDNYNFGTVCEAVGVCHSQTI